MSDEKKPRKKPAPKPEAPTPPVDDMTRADASANAQTKMRDAVLLAALPHAAFDGFTDAVLQKAAADAGVAKADVARLFEKGAIGLVEHYSHWADRQMVAALEAQDLRAMKIRERIAASVLARLAALAPHKEAARRAAALLSLPMNAGVGARLVYATVDTMWRSAGDTATDFNFYTKRGILAGVYGTTAMRWFTDTSDGEQTTKDFLAARIENVMQFEKFKSQAKLALANFPVFADWAGRAKTK